MRNLNHQIIKSIKKCVCIIEEKLPGLKMDRLSKVDRITDYGYVYPSSVLASLEVIIYMLQATDDCTLTRNITLRAETQVGKTSVIGNVCFLLENNDIIRDYIKIEFHSSYYISAMSDTANKSQVSYDLTTQTGNRLDKKCILKNVMHNLDMLSALRKDDINYIRNGIIFNDESHFSPEVYNVINKWIISKGVSRNGLSPMFDRNVFMIDISATAFDESVSNKLYKNRKVITMIPSDDYRGIRDFSDRNLYRQYFSLDNTEGVKKLHEVLKSFEYKKGYYFIRINSRSKICLNKLVPDGFNSINYFQENRIEINDILENIPDKPTIVFVKDKMKASFHLPNSSKKNIVMMFERYSTSLKRTAFIVQSFVGRATGYHTYDIIIYTDLDDIKSHIDWLYNSNNIPLTNKTTKEEFNSNSTSLVSYDFSDNKEDFDKMFSLRGINGKKEVICDIISSIYNIDILNRYKFNESYYNTTYFYTINKKSYAGYILRAYDDIKNNNGLSNLKFLRFDKNHKYNDGDNIFSIYFDKENYNIIIAEIIYHSIVTVKDFKYTLHKSSVHSIENTSINSNVDNLRDSSAKYPDAVLNNDGEDVKMRLTYKNEIVLFKNCNVFTEDIEGYIENGKLIKDIIFTNYNNIDALEMICKIVSNDKKNINDIMCGDKKFVDMI